MYAAIALLFMGAFEEAGYLPIPDALKFVITLGFGGLLIKAAGRIFKHLDEEVVGRERATYIRCTGEESSTRIEAIAVADKIVDDLLKKINDKREGSTIESRTNLISKNQRGKYRATTYVTVLVAGKALSEAELPRDLSPARCKAKTTMLKKQCVTETSNLSGYCDHHDQRSHSETVRQRSRESHK